MREGPHAQFSVILHTMKRTFFIMWLIVVLSFGALEAAALIAPGGGDTFSELARTVLFSHPVVWVAGAVLWVWSFYHLFLTRR